MSPGRRRRPAAPSTRAAPSAPPDRPASADRVARADRRAWVVWGFGLVAYSVAVMHRTTFGVAGVAAQARFEVSASALAGFTVLQLLVYAGLQVPVGLAVDRWGSRALLVGGGVVMAAGQAVLALAPHVAVAYLGRALVGAGDAATFISVLRLLPTWFPARTIPVLTQLTGLTGQVGQLLSAVPVALVLHEAGWRPAFLGCAAAGLVTSAAVAATVRDTPPGRPTVRRVVPLHQVGRDLAAAWRRPGTRLGLWAHFSTQFPATVFTLMWGLPFLVLGEGCSPGEVGVLFSLIVVTGMVAGPVLGLLVARRPDRRTAVVLAVIAANVLAWTLVLVLPGRAPLPVLVLLALGVAVGPAGSMIGFDFARTANPVHRQGAASGIVNIGGFVASLVTMQLVGLVLDLRRPDGHYVLADFRWAMATQYLIWLGGVVAVLRLARAPGDG